MSTGSIQARAEGWLGNNDVRLLIVLALAIGGLYALFSVVLGFQLNGTVNTLRRVAFLSVIYAMLALALNLQWGYAGLFNLGAAGFMAIGVYTMGILTAPVTASPPGFGLPLPVAIVGAILVTGIVGGLAALPAIRLRADYLAIVTVAFSEIVRLTLRAPGFANTRIAGVAFGTGGATGLSLPSNPIRILFYTDPAATAPAPNGLGAAIFSAVEPLGIEQTLVIGWAYVVVLCLCLGLLYWLMIRIGKSPFGRVLKSIREDQQVTQALGKDTRLFKIKTFALGCALMGLIAILWRLSGGYASPRMFKPIQTFYIFIALFIGGTGSPTGSIVGGALFASLLFEGPSFIRRVVAEYLQLSNAPDTLVGALAELGTLDITPLLAYSVQDVSISALRLMLLGIVLVYLMQRHPDGLLGHRKAIASSVTLSQQATREDDNE
ncbi:branched-chain amino acid ABC transporter permease [Haloarcula sp. AONF1]